MSEQIDLLRVIVPPSFAAFMWGTSVIDGDPMEYSYEPNWQLGAWRLKKAFLEDQQVIEVADWRAVAVLAAYADMCIEVNLYDDKNSTELWAAEVTLARCLIALEVVGEKVEMYQRSRPGVRRERAKERSRRGL